jgi:hypothetical protein
MLRTLPRLVAFALTVCSLLHVSTAAAAAQDQLASTALLTTAAVAPGALTNTVLFPATPVAEAAQPSRSIREADFSGIRRPALLPAMYATAVALQALDAHSTMTALNRGAVEANPAMRGVVGNRSALVAVKVGAAAGTIFVAEKMWRRNRVAAIAMMAVVNGISAAVVAHNYRVAAQLR